MRLQRLILGFFLAFVLLTIRFWPSGRAQLREMFLPGDPATTKLAVGEMVDSIREGAGIGDALTAFCREILTHAETAD